MKKSLVKVQNLSAGFFSTIVLKEINLEIPAHKVVALIGPSGCGKSTFLRCLNRMHEEVPGAEVKGQILLERSKYL